MNSRLKQFLAAENISQSQFADTLGVARASISHILSGRNKPGYDFFASVARHYPTLNLSWLISGKGRMYGNAQPSAESIVEIPSAATADTDLFSPQESDLRPAVRPENTAAGRADSRLRPDDKPMKPLPEVHDEGRRITKVLVFYDDNTYQELK